MDAEGPDESRRKRAKLVHQDVIEISDSSSSNDSSATNKNILPQCLYGVKCYRKNPEHLTTFSHPLLEKIYDSMISSDNFSEIPEPLLPEFNKSGMERRTLLEQIRVLKEAKQINNGAGAVTSSPLPKSTLDDLSDIREQRRLKYLESKAKQSEDIDIPSTSTTSATKKKALSMKEKWEASCPFNYFLTKVKEIRDEKEGVFSASFKDLFHSSMGEVKTILHVNFMVDPEWFLEQTMDAGLEGKQTRIIFNGVSKDYEGMTQAFPWIKVFGVKSPFPYGHHHSKMTIAQYTDLSIRFFVYTANLIESDWENRTQGIWISPVCPKIDTATRSPLEGESPTKFRSDIIQYLSTYPVQASKAWIEVIKTVDCSKIKVFFVASAPVTTQSGTSGFQWGTCKMEKILKSVQNSETDPSWPLVIQCSSIGTLGKGVQDWVQGELGTALAGKDRIQRGPIRLVYPSHSNVKSSYEGLHGGGCLPYSASTHMKQLWLEKHLCQWKADSTGRSRAVPHIKSYFRLSPDNTKLAWFLLTSANLSKAAWGKLSKSGDRLSVMSWEAGILFVPQLLISQNHFDLDKNSEHSFPLPIDVPLVKYEAADKPFVFDTLQALILKDNN